MLKTEIENAKKELKELQQKAESLKTAIPVLEMLSAYLHDDKSKNELKVLEKLLKGEEVWYTAPENSIQHLPEKIEMKNFKGCDQTLFHLDYSSDSNQMRLYFSGADIVMGCSSGGDYSFSYGEAVDKINKNVRNRVSKNYKQSESLTRFIGSLYKIKPILQLYEETKNQIQHYNKITAEVLKQRVNAWEKQLQYEVKELQEAIDDIC